MQDLLPQIRSKIRGLVRDFAKSDFQTFNYETSNIFTLAEPNINSIDSVLRNGAELGSGEYSYNSITNKIIIDLASGNDFTVGDIVEVDYTFNKYSNTEINKYIESALVWISLFSSGDDDYELEDEDIFPVPGNKTTDLIAIIASILIKPNYSEYKLPTLTVKYPKTVSKEDRIQKIISRFDMGIGFNGTITYE